MTDTKAPERIWAWPDIGDHFNPAKPDWSGGIWEDEGEPHSEPYVRADLLTAAEAERDKAVAMKDALIGDKIMLRSELAAVEGERNRLAMTLGTMTARAKMAMRCQDDRFNFGWIVEEADAILALLDTPAAEALERVRAEEREACAQVAEAHKPTQSLITNSDPNGYWRGVEENAFSIAAAIRARGET